MRFGSDLECEEGLMGEKPVQRTKRPYVLGRSRFGMISSVEGLRLSFSAGEEFAEDEKRGLTPRQRRARIIAKYSKK